MTLFHSEGFKKAIVIRPGALGDTLVAMPVIRFVKDVLCAQSLVFVAPSAKATLFARKGWADFVFDWESAIFSALFTPKPLNNPVSSKRLRDIFHDADLVISLAGSGNEEDDAPVVSTMRQLAPNALVCSLPFDPGTPDLPVRLALYDAVNAWCTGQGLVTRSEALSKRNECDSASFIVMEPPQTQFNQPYLVIHPGSGSLKKNWPKDRFIALAEKLLQITVKEKPFFRQLIVTAGEADGVLGDMICDAIPDSILLKDLGLSSLAAVLAHASVYIGNDSGVSHLAASVETVDHHRPLTVTIFGPTESTKWAPRNSSLLHAGFDMLGVEADDAYRSISGFITEFLLDR